MSVDKSVFDESKDVVDICNEEEEKEEKEKVSVFDLTAGSDVYTSSSSDSTSSSSGWLCLLCYMT